ncbi:hypothetical protein DFA_02305 [Cavenderia fasciculata]|uniref:Uncharacterized protein n=1 Tax=Cavenderia fasciculata TaxID=261658 RepID=F4PZ32_CACFS|nr:uncharacterized protein DFA_02305 [Cavenderia fasciculata]EGG19061.1 hypothetical protein DFA_02305 [Cavenderia fasciculata]|eukprot:XP_004366694.1 hypothetical protein DFA_02305 [Cavenderia fasciculata]
MSLLSLSNLLVSHIISSIDNVDIICLLLTCKQLFNDSSVRRSIKFKGVGGAIDTDNRDISLQFKATTSTTRYKLLSFKDILVNSISLNQHVVLEHNTAGDKEIFSNRSAAAADNIITTALVTHYNLQAINSLYETMPSIETLFIKYRQLNLREKTTIDLGSISRLPNLQRLSVQGNSLKLGPHSSLKSLNLDIGTCYTASELGLDQFVSLTELALNNFCVPEIGPGVLPSSLTSLTLTLFELPPRDTFIALTSLVYLDIFVEKGLDKELEQEQQQQQIFIDLSTLHNLKKLVYNENLHREDGPIEIIVPPNLKILSIWSTQCVPITPPQQQCTTTTLMPVLEKLYLLEGLLTGGKINLLSQCPSLKKLCIYQCFKTIPSNLIPPHLEKLSIHNYSTKDILDQFVYPPSLKHLTYLGDFYDGSPSVTSLPESLVKLKSKLNASSSLNLLPSHLKKLVWMYRYGGQGEDIDLAQSNFPPNLETIDFSGMKGLFKVTIPPVTKYLSIFLSQKQQQQQLDPIFSITSRITIPTKDQQQQQQQEQWLPINTTHLNCSMSCSQSKWSFRLDEIINHTNVRYLSIINQCSTATNIQFSIQRLDSDNRNVLVLERQSLTGGIISQLKNNVDIVCLLLTCKKLYHHNSNSLKRSIQFKGIEPIDIDKVDISLKFKGTATRFNLLSFKDILENSIISDQLLILSKKQEDDNKEYPLWIQDRIYYTDNRIDKSNNITTALVTHYQHKVLDSNLLYKIPSIETLFINEPQHNGIIDLGSISQLPNLQRLSVQAHLLKLGNHSSLQSLTLGLTTRYTASELRLDQFISLTELTANSFCLYDIGPGLLPSSLTSLDLAVRDFPPRDTFIALTSLVNFKLCLEQGLYIFRLQQEEEEEQQHLFLDLFNLHNLKKLEYSENWTGKKGIIEIIAPLNLKILSIWSNRSVQISTPGTLPLLLLERIVIGGKINLSSLQYGPSLKKLFIYNCWEPIPSDMIPSTLEKLMISISNVSEGSILGQIVFPPSLTHLTILGSLSGHDEPFPPLPESLVKLKLEINSTASHHSTIMSLPRHLKKLALKYAFEVQCEDFDLSQSNYLPNLETIDISYKKGFFTFPPSTKYLSITLIHKDQQKNCLPIYSIATSLTIPKDINDQSQQQQQWLPINTTHLTCRIFCTQAKWSFRLDEIINHTNVRYLSIIIFYSKTTNLQFSIQRLDSDNRNVLVLERQSMTGGIITQRRISNTNINQQQQPQPQPQQQYDPIYLHWDLNSPFEFNWSFVKKIIK